MSTAAVVAARAPVRAPFTSWRSSGRSGGRSRPRSAINARRDDVVPGVAGTTRSSDSGASAFRDAGLDARRLHNGVVGPSHIDQSEGQEIKRGAVSMGAHSAAQSSTVVEEEATITEEIATDEDVSSNITAIRYAISEEEPASTRPVDISDLQAVILAGGADEQNPLTRWRARSALRVAASYRLIDFPLSNLLNSKVKQIYVLTQWNSHSLHSHITRAFPPEIFGIGKRGGFVDVLPTYQTPDVKDWSSGSADVVRRHLEAGALRTQGDTGQPEAYLILSGEAMYRMDYSEMLRTHNESGADITIASVVTRAGDAAAKLGVLAVSPVDGRVEAFVEKPSQAWVADMADCSNLEEGQSVDECLLNVSMGVYIFSGAALKSLLGISSNKAGGDAGAPDAASEDARNRHHDIGGDVIPAALARGLRVQAHRFGGFWQPVRTLREWFDANLALATQPAHSAGGEGFVTGTNPVQTQLRFLPPARFHGETSCEQSIVSDGCVVRAGCFIAGSIIGPSAIVGRGCRIEQSIVTGSPTGRGRDSRSAPDIGDGSVLRNVVCDSDVRIGANCVITNEAGVAEADETEKGYVIRDGIVAILKGADIPDGTVI